METQCPEPDVAASATQAALDTLWQRAQHTRLSPEECEAALLLDRARRLLGLLGDGLDVREQPPLY